MKNILFAIVAVSVLASCSSPVLKWIDTPDGTSGGLADKEITSFSFGIDGETDLPIGKNPDSAGKIPILVILPEGANVENSNPTIAYIGKSLAPAADEARNFSAPNSPVVYTVTARDDSTQDYVVRIYFKGSASKAIIRFALDVSGTGDSELLAEGVIDEQAGTIVVSVPAGTNVNNMTAHIAHTGDRATDPSGGSHSNVSFDFIGDFSAPTTWTVFDKDNEKKSYAVTVVVREKSHDKKITHFSFGISGEEVIISGEPQPDGKYPILSILPDTTSSVTSSTSTIDIRNITPFVVYTGVSISPGPDTAADFSAPKIYTVTAEDRSARDYVVTVIRKDDIFESFKQITGFYFREPLVEGIIDETAGTIALTVPQGTNLSALQPEIYYIGASISPGDGQPRDFADSAETPVQYTVRARNGTTKSYMVSVFTAPAPPVVDVSGSGSGAKVDVGVNAGASSSADSGYYTVIVEFPAYVESPVLNITYPAANAVDNETINQILNQLILLQNKEVYNRITNETINNYITNSNTTNNTNYTEISSDVKVDVTVINPPSDTPSPAPSPSPPPPDTTASIDGFFFASPAAIGEIGTGTGTPADPIPIAVTVPYGTDLRSLAATVFYAGKEIVGIPGANPLKDAARNFTSPIDYTVIANDGATSKTYRVRVTAAVDTARAITGFSFSETTPTSVMISAVPDATGKYPIVITIPPGQSHASLTPVITHTGASIAGAGIASGGSGIVTAGTAVTNFDPTTPVEYTVSAADGSATTYAVTVRNEEPVDDSIEITGFYFTDPLAVGEINQTAHAITVTVPAKTDTASLTPMVYFKGISLTPASGVPNDFSKPATYTVAGNSGNFQPYTVRVNFTPLDNRASIDGFYFSSPVAVGNIGKTDGTEGAGTTADPYLISVTVPYGTDLRSLAATICYTGKEIAGIPGPNLLKDNARSFTAPVDYTVIANDGTSKTYRVTVTAAPNNAREISAFSFDGITPTSAMISAVPNAAGKYPIVATIPQGQSFASLTPVITHTGASITGEGIPAGGAGTVKAESPVTSFNATTPVDYTVRAADGSDRTYAVTVRNAAPADDAIEITGFYFTDPLAVGAINQTTDAITVTVPSKTATASLKPVVYFKGMSLTPGSGAANNFSGPVTYTVAGNSGKTRSYTVTVISTPSSASDITRFVFPDIPNAETIIGAMPDSDGNYPISVWVPAGTELGDLGSPDITYTGVSVTPGEGTPGDFNSPKTYTVTAEDGSTKTYTVTVEPQSGSAKIITSLVFDEVPVTGGSLRVVASINQAAYAITAEVPFAADISALKPTITYIGRSIAGSSGGDKTANPFTDTPRNFSGPQTYTVKDQDGAGQSYTVTVIRNSSVAVSFTGESDSTIIEANNFDPATGIITVTVSAANVSPPYEWYLDGVKQPVSSSQNVFTLNVGDGTFVPGKHEIMVSGRKGGLHYTGKAYFTVSGGTK